MKMNCWEFIRCGREPGGPNTVEFGECPTSTEARLNNIHGGKNAGRACWAVTGTFCKGKVQGTFARKIKDCAACDSYKKVKEEEGNGSFVMTITLLKMLE